MKSNFVSVPCELILTPVTTCYYYKIKLPVITHLNFLCHAGEISDDLNRAYERARVAKEETVPHSPMKVTSFVFFTLAAGFEHPGPVSQRYFRMVYSVRPVLLIGLVADSCHIKKPQQLS